MKTCCLITAAFILFAVCILPASAQAIDTDPEEGVPARALGDQLLQFSAATVIPLFFQSVSGIAPTGLTIGGVFSLQWNAYLSPQIRLGLEIGGKFSFSRRVNPLFIGAVVPTAI